MRSNESLIEIGQCYAFVRSGHEWNGCEVAVLDKTERGYKVARASNVCEGLLAKHGSKKRKLQTWVAKESELI